MWWAIRESLKVPHVPCDVINGSHVDIAESPVSDIYVGSLLA